MLRHQVRSTEDAFDYLIDCTLATVCDLASKKSRSKSEFVRQIAIAQAGINWARYFNVPLTGRGADVVGSVANWAEQFDVCKEFRSLEGNATKETT